MKELMEIREILKRAGLPTAQFLTLEYKDGIKRLIPKAGGTVEALENIKYSATAGEQIEKILAFAYPLEDTTQAVNDILKHKAGEVDEAPPLEIIKEPKVKKQKNKKNKIKGGE